MIKPDDRRIDYTVIAMSHGHHWIRAFGMVCCRDCGMIRRGDDNNKPCRGIVRVGPRDQEKK